MTTRVIRPLLVALLTAVLLAPVGAGAAEAPAGEVAWGVRPADNHHGNGRANYAFLAAPGEVIEDAVVVSNHSDAPLTLRV